MIAGVEQRIAIGHGDAALGPARRIHEIDIEMVMDILSAGMRPAGNIRNTIYSVLLFGSESPSQLAWEPEFIRHIIRIQLFLNNKINTEFSGSSA